MKVVINSCFGGYGLSPKAYLRIGQLLCRPVYFFNSSVEGGSRISPEEAKESFCFHAVDLPDFMEREGRIPGRIGDYKEQNKFWNNHAIPDFSDDRANPILVQVVKELGQEASGLSASLKIVEIPDDVKWHIEEYDGCESIHENHRVWK